MNSGHSFKTTKHCLPGELEVIAGLALSQATDSFGSAGRKARRRVANW